MEKKYKVRADFLKSNELNALGIIEFIEMYNKEHKSDLLKVPSELTASRWLTGEKCPPIDTLVALSQRTHTNVSYLLGFTDIATPNDTYTINFNLAEKRNSFGISRESLANATGTTYTTVASYENNGMERKSLSSLLALAGGLGCSIDYLLGLTLFLNWGDEHKQNTSFSGIKPGTPLRIITDSLNTTALLSLDGKSLIMPDGKSILCTSNSLKGATVKKFVEV